MSASNFAFRFRVLCLLVVVAAPNVSVLFGNEYEDLVFSGRTHFAVNITSYKNIVFTAIRPDPICLSHNPLDNMLAISWQDDACVMYLMWTKQKIWMRKNDYSPPHNKATSFKKTLEDTVVSLKNSEYLWGDEEDNIDPVMPCDLKYPIRKDYYTARFSLQTNSTCELKIKLDSRQIYQPPIDSMALFPSIPIAAVTSMYEFEEYVGGQLMSTAATEQSEQSPWMWVATCEFIVILLFIIGAFVCYFCFRSEVKEVANVDEVVASEASYGPQQATVASSEATKSTAYSNEAINTALELSTFIGKGHTTAKKKNHLKPFNVAVSAKRNTRTEYKPPACAILVTKSPPRGWD